MATTLLLVLLLSTTTTTTSAASSDDPTGFVYAGCSQQKYSPGSPYQFNADSVLSSLANAASLFSFSNFTSSSASPSSPVSGLHQCRADIPLPLCASCIRTALTQLSALCPSAAGAALQLNACYLRYGNDSFLGRQDTSLVFKKCGPDPRDYEADLVGMRDVVLGQLAGGGYYRAGTAGYVQALAQCDGDINDKECGDCVQAAVAQLRGGCAAAVSGDVFLGKCYARYWSDGVYGHKSSNGDETGKTLAIIIGLLAGVALIIVFLSFIRRAGSDGK